MAELILAQSELPMELAGLPLTRAEHQKVDILEAGLATFPQTQMEPVHHFSKGMYIRELTLPAEQFIVSKLHKTEHMCILGQGEVSIWRGGGLVKLTAPLCFKSHPGARRVLYTHTECVFYTIHATNVTDLDDLEEEIIAKPEDREELLLQIEAKYPDLKGL